MAGIIEIIQGTFRTISVIDPVIRTILIAIVILLIGLVAGKLISRFVKHLLHQLEADKTFKATTGWKFSIEKTISSFVEYFIYFIVIIMALEKIGITSAVLNMVAGIIILLVLISIVLAIKDFVPNMMAGLILKGKKEYKKGVKIQVKRIEGKIQEIGLLETRVLTSKKDIILIPNSIFVKHEITIKK
ncbi:mechanosensitive ion channel domain-containing protein [Nanoarchaeota archaeon]